MFLAEGCSGRADALGDLQLAELDVGAEARGAFPLDLDVWQALRLVGVGVKTAA